jgi:hypothetical protein
VAAAAGGTAVTVFGALFTGGTLAYAMLLREMPVPFDTARRAALGRSGAARVPAHADVDERHVRLLRRPRVRPAQADPGREPGKTVEGASAGVAGT